MYRSARLAATVNPQRLRTLTPLATAQIRNFQLNQDWIIRPDREHKTFPVYNKATGSLLGHAPEFDVQDTRVAIDKAYASAKAWRELTAKERGAILHNWASLITHNKQYLAELLCEEQGKPMAEATGEIAYGTAFITWYAEEAKRVYGEIIPQSTKNQRILVMHQPVGVCALITPWNFPMAMITRKAGVALAVGCTAVVKPAEDTPLMAHAIMALAHQAGIPKDVFSLVSCSREGVSAIGKELCTNEKVAKVSFTGSTAVGKILLSQSASTVKRVSLELGGNAPFIVFQDANLDNAVEGLLASKYRNSGQTCVCTNRIIVHSSVVEAFTQKLIAKVNTLVVGNGRAAGTTQGPLINEAAVVKVERLLADATSKGAKIVLGGNRHALGGTFFQPTVVTGVTPTMDIFKNEIFGPVASIVPFDTEEQALELANDSRSGLAGYFYTNDLARAWRVAENMETGMVGHNFGVISSDVAPFGGVKESGFGREGSRFGLHDYLNIKYFCMNVSA